MRVLLVEDSEPMRRALTVFLRGLADEIHECRDGAEALAAYSRLRPDWVLMDIKMGVVDGLTATRQITAAFPDARVAILTSFDDAELREAARGAGAVAYLTKDNLVALRALLAAPPPASNPDRNTTCANDYGGRT